MKKPVIAILLTFSFSPLHAALSALYVFGDSLSDIGNVNQSSNGLFWHQRLGLMTERSDSGGTIYARGGARSADIQAQVSDYLADSGGMVDPSATYVIFVGGNDLAGIATSGGDLLATQAAIGAAVSNILGQALTLRTLGVDEIYIMNAPDISLTPLVQILTGGNPFILGYISGLATAWNTLLADQIAALADPAVRMVDINTTFTDLYQNPSNYGLTNVTGTIESEMPANPSEYLFFDPFHPGNTAHNELGKLFLATVPEPSTVLSLALGSLLVLLRRHRRVA